MSFVYSPSHKIALPIHGLRFLSIRIQFLFPIDFKDGFQACHGIFFAERPPQQWQPHQQHAAAFNSAKSREGLCLASRGGPDFSSLLGGIDNKSKNKQHCIS